MKIDDFVKVNIPGEYIPYYSNAPYVRKPITYYEQKKASIYTYRGISVSVKETLNIDYSHRAWEIAAVNGKRVKNISAANVRQYIDNLYIDLEKKVNDMPDECAYKLPKGDDETVYERAIELMYGRKYTPRQKRYILKDLLSKGLPTVDAVNFLDAI